MDRSGPAAARQELMGRRACMPVLTATGRLRNSMLGGRHRFIKWEGTAMGTDERDTRGA
jgi:hypothetical protein